MDPWGGGLGVVGRGLEVLRIGAFGVTGAGAEGAEVGVVVALTVVGVGDLRVVGDGIVTGELASPVSSFTGGMGV